MKTKEINHEKYGKCLKISNDILELIIPLEYGIRIMSFSFINSVNILGDEVDITLDLESDDEKLKGKKWNMRGGHRIWHAPEVNPRTYIPDDSPISYEIKENKVILTQETEYYTGIQKSLELEFISDQEVKLNNILTNKNPWDIETAVWVISIMSRGGEATVPFSKRQSDFLSTKHLEIWPYTDLTDSRFTLNTDYFRLKQSDAERAFKIGINNEEGIAEYRNNNLLFTKKFTHFMNEKYNEKYPDNGCSFEIYTNNQILELESLSPVKIIRSEEKIEHVEIWRLEKEN